MVIDNSAFYKAQEQYLKDRTNKKTWDFIFLTVYKCCLSCAKKQAKKLLDYDTMQGKAIDAASYLMNRYKKQPAFRINKLEYMCKMTVHSFLHRTSVQRRDKTLVYTDTDRAFNSHAVVTDYVADIEKRKIERYLMTPAYMPGGFDELSRCKQLELF